MNKAGMSYPDSEKFRGGELILRKVLKVFAGVLVGLALLGIHAGCVLATGEQSVKELIGRDGDYLLTSSIAQEFTGKVEVSGNVALLWNGSKVSFLERDESGFWNIMQEMEGYPQYYFSHMTLSENTAIVNALREREDGDYGVLYIFGRNQDGVWRQTQKIEGFNYLISGNIMVVGERYYYAPSCSMRVYERDENNTWQEKQTISFKNGDAGNIESDLTTYYPGSIWNNCIIITSGEYGAFIFERDASGIWKYTKRLTDPEGQNAFYRGFGSSVLTSGNDVFFPSNQGTFLFERKPDGNWQQKSKLPGYWLRISGNCALTEEDNALYIFERDQNGTWQRKQELTMEIGKGDQYYGISLKDNYAGFVSYRYSDYLSINYVFERNPDGIWQQRFKTNPWDDIIAQGNLSFYNDGVICSTYTVNLYRLNLPDQFIIPNDKKYLVFKVEKNSSIRSLDAVTDKINFEAIGSKSDPDEPDKVDEVTYQLLLDKARYIEGTDAFYYIVDLSELKAKYIEMRNKDFHLENPGVGYQMNQNYMILWLREII
jgi:hypothetical protein